MNSADQNLCPIPGMGHCLYDRCPYWDAARQECDASCLESQEPGEPGPAADPCTIPWTEDFD
jgi:hypothetical protein